MVKTIKEARPVPPYLSVSRLNQLFNLLSTRSFTEITADDFVNRGFSKPDSFLAIQTLRFLGLLTPDNKTTEKVRLFSMKSGDKEQKLQEVLREAYKKLFETMPNAERLTRNELHDELMAIYGISPRLAGPATLAFIWLCKMVGIKTAEEISTKPPKVFKRSVANQSEKKIGIAEGKSAEGVHSQEEDAGYHKFEIVKGIRLLIKRTPEVDESLLKGELSEARSQLEEFAKKTGLSEEVHGEVAESD